MLYPANDGCRIHPEGRFDITWERFQQAVDKSRRDCSAKQFQSWDGCCLMGAIFVSEERNWTSTCPSSHLERKYM